MRREISDEQLEAFALGTLRPAETKRIEAALQDSSALRQRLEAIQRDQRTVEELKDSFAIVLPEEQEEQIINRAIGNLDSTLRGRDS